MQIATLALPWCTSRNSAARYDGESNISLPAVRASSWATSPVGQGLKITHYKLTPARHEDAAGAGGAGTL